MRYIIIILFLSSCMVQRNKDVKKECNGYWYTNQEYNLTDNKPWHPPKESYILAYDSLLIIVDHHTDTDLYVSIPFEVSVEMTRKKCKYLTNGTLFIYDKKRGTMSVNRVTDDGLDEYFIYMNMKELDWNETKKILEDVY